MQNAYPMKKLRTLQEFLRERLANKEKAISYLDVSLEEYQIDGDTSFFLQGIRNVIEAQGGVVELAKQIQVDAETLSEVLSSKHAPQLDTLINIITTLGGRLSIIPLDDAEPGPEDYPIAPSKSTVPEIEVSTEIR